MTTQSITRLPATIGFAGFLGDVARACAAIATGWRAAREYRRLSAENRQALPQQIARAVFERHFA